MNVVGINVDFLSVLFFLWSYYVIVRDYNLSIFRVVDICLLCKIGNICNVLFKICK